MLKSLPAGQGWVLAREIKAQVVGKRLVSAECPAWSALTSPLPSEAHVQMGGPRFKGVRLLSQDPQ